jgi:hypothetical protein
MFSPVLLIRLTLGLLSGISLAFALVLDRRDIDNFTEDMNKIRDKYDKSTSINL